MARPQHSPQPSRTQAPATSFDPEQNPSPKKNICVEDGRRKYPRRIRKSSFKPVESDQFQIGPRSWDHAGLSHDEIAALFRMPSSNSVAQTIRRTKTHDVQPLKVLKQVISKRLTPLGLNICKSFIVLKKVMGKRVLIRFRGT